MKASVQLYICSILYSYAPINVKPDGGGGGESGNPREFDRDAYPQGGDFDNFF